MICYKKYLHRCDVLKWKEKINSEQRNQNDCLFKIIINFLDPVPPQEGDLPSLAFPDECVDVEPFLLVHF